MTSFPNANETNVALNVWWYKNDSYTPQDCTMTAEQATLDLFKFNDQEENIYGKSDDSGETDAKPYE